MKRVLILANHDVGLFNFRAELLERLIHQGFDVHFSVPDGEKVPMLEAMGGVFHPTVMNRRGKNLFQDLLLLRFYLRLIHKLGPTVVLSYTAKPNIYGGVACQITKTLQLANITGLGSELHGNWLTARILRTLYRIGIRKAHGVFFQNEANRQYFLEHQLLSSCKLQSVKVLPGSGVNTDRFTPNEAHEFSEKGLSRFLFISRIMKDKGIEEFLAAAESVKSRYPLATFDILGFYESETYRNRVESMVSRGIINSVGFSQDTRNEMKTVDCVVLPSHHEGMSNVLLEAAASGIPIITTNIPGCREAVLDGVSGYLCNARDSQDLTEQMVRFIVLGAIEKKAMGASGRKLMLERFDRQFIIDEYMKDIQLLI